MVDGGAICWDGQDWEKEHILEGNQQFKRRHVMLDMKLRSIYNWTLVSNKREWNLAICDNMDGHRGFYAQWHKSDGEIEILYDFTNMWNLPKLCHIPPAGNRGSSGAPSQMPVGGAESRLGCQTDLECNSGSVSPLWPVSGNFLCLSEPVVLRIKNNVCEVVGIW